MKATGKNGALKAIMKQTGWTQTRLAEALGAKSQSVVSERLNQANISLNVAQEMLNKMGYEIVFQPISGGRRKDGAYVIDGIDPSEAGDSK